MLRQENGAEVPAGGAKRDSKRKMEPLSQLVDSFVRGADQHGGSEDSLYLFYADIMSKVRPT